MRISAYRKMDKGNAETTVRIAGLDDVPALAGLRALWADVAAEPGFERRMREWLMAEGERRTMWLAEIDREAVGMATMLEYRRMPWPGRADSRWGYIGNMFVREGHRRRGSGSALLGAVIAVATERRYARLVLAPSREALSFYRRAGFELADGGGGELLLTRPGPT